MLVSVTDRDDNEPTVYTEADNTDFFCRRNPTAARILIENSRVPAHWKPLHAAEIRNRLMTIRADAIISISAATRMR
jgi:hypothetical protein